MQRVTIQDNNLSKIPFDFLVTTATQLTIIHATAMLLLLEITPG